MLRFLISLVWVVPAVLSYFLAVLVAIGWVFPVYLLVCWVVLGTGLAFLGERCLNIIKNISLNSPTK